MFKSIFFSTSIRVIQLRRQKSSRKLRRVSENFCQEPKWWKNLALQAKMEVRRQHQVPEPDFSNSESRFTYGTIKKNIRAKFDFCKLCQYSFDAS